LHTHKRWLHCTQTVCNVPLSEFTVAINRISCPECGAGLKSAAGFKLGATISCPKCETDFEVEEQEEEEQPKKKSKTASTGAVSKKKPIKAAVEDDEDEEDEQPKKKKKKKKRSSDDGDDQWSYKNSWIRYAILTVLIVVMCVLGYMLHLKQKREAGGAFRIESQQISAYPVRV
jgi:uncharacterized Zn finger protein (UPF0148 family)